MEFQNRTEGSDHMRKHVDQPLGAFKCNQVCLPCLGWKVSGKGSKYGSPFQSLWKQSRVPSKRLKGYLWAFYVQFGFLWVPPSLLAATFLFSSFFLVPSVRDNSVQFGKSSYKYRTMGKELPNCTKTHSGHFYKIKLPQNEGKELSNRNSSPLNHDYPWQKMHRQMLYIWGLF